MRMESRAQSKKFLLILALFVLSRIYVLPFGFGLDSDAWSVAAVAKKVAHNWGYYEASRLPGYPIPEHFFALSFKIFGVGFLQANFVAFVFGFLALIAMWQLSKALKIEPFWPAFALAFHPIILISSTSTMDYIFGACFLIWALYFYIKERFLISGAMFGLACGSRITIAIGIVAFLLAMIKERKNFSAILEWSAALAIISALSFAPVFSTYGGRFFSYSHTKINFFAAGYRLLHEFFGVPFSIGFVIALLIKKFRGERPAESSKKFLLWALFVALWIPYLRFPLDPFYLSSALCAGILLLASYFPKRSFRTLAILIFVSSLISLFPIDKYQYREHDSIKPKILEAGPALSDAIERATIQKQALEFASNVENLQGKSVYVLGDLFFNVSWDVLKKDCWESVPFAHQHKIFVSTMPKKFLQKLKGLGWRIYYYDGIFVDYQTRRAYDYSLKELGAKPLKSRD